MLAMKLTYFGHSCFLLETSQARLLLDPFLNGNPASPIKAAQVQCDYVLVSHGHEDHSGDALEIAKRCDATLVANYEIAEYFGAKGAKTHGMNPGGGFNFPFGRVKLTIAHHTSSLEAGLQPVYLGVPCGLLISADGRNIYHAGDTAIFGDMLLYGTLYPIDMALIPIGGAFTMDAMQAAKSLRLLTPKKTIPMHYGTFPMMAPNADEFVKLAKKYAYGVDVSVLQPGGTYILQP